MDRTGFLHRTRLASRLDVPQSLHPVVSVPPGSSPSLSLFLFLSAIDFLFVLFPHSLHRSCRPVSETATPSLGMATISPRSVSRWTTSHFNLLILMTEMICILTWCVCHPFDRLLGVSFSLLFGPSLIPRYFGSLGFENDLSVLLGVYSSRSATRLLFVVTTKYPHSTWALLSEEEKNRRI